MLLKQVIESIFNLNLSEKSCLYQSGVCRLYRLLYLSTINNLLLLKASENADFIMSALNLYNL